MTSITSSQNAVIKEIKALKKRKAREEKGLYFIEGIRFVEEALKEKVHIVRVLVSEGLTANKGGAEILQMVEERKHEVFMVDRKLFEEISDTENPQGIMAVIKASDYSLEEMFKEDNFFILLDSLQDPGNMGTIIRTADAAGVNGVIISKGCVDIYNPKVLRSTMGSVFRMPVCVSDNLAEAVEKLKQKGIRVCAAHLKGSMNYFDIEMKGNMGVIIGNEANGISDEVSSKADMLVRIPMMGRAESLNASVAASLLMYEVVRQRLKL